MRYIFYTVVILILAGCGTIPKDNTAAPIKNNLYTAEFTACGRSNVGLVTCNFNSEEDLEAKFLQVPLYGDGEFQIKSTKCNYFVNARYSGNTFFKASFATLMKDKLPDQAVCDFDIKVFMDGMDQGYRGILSLVHSDRPLANVEYWAGSALASFKGVGEIQLRAGTNTDQYLKYLTTKPGTLVWFGCDMDGQKDYDSNPQLALSEVFLGGLIDSKSCILETGFIPTDGSPAEVFTINIQIFTKAIVRLADPKLKYDGEKLKVIAEPVVALIAIGDDYKLQSGTKEQKHSAKVSKDQIVWVRLATANGRYSLYQVLNGEIIWTSLIKY